MSFVFKSKAQTSRSAANEVREPKILESVRSRLKGSAYPAVRRLRCNYHEGVLTVRGRVASFHERQVAWALLGELEGVDEFVDRIEVIAGASRSGE